MGDIALRGAPLLKMVGLAKKRDLNFAYCPGNDPAEDVFVLDIKKKPEIMGRLARGEGTGTKIGFGTAKVTGKVMTLSCERALPQAAKKLKKFLKSENIAMNIIVLDVEGNVLEQEVEDLGENEDADTNDVDDNADARLDPLKARAVKLQAALRAVPRDAQAPLAAAFKGAVGVMRAGDLDKAEATFSKIENAVVKLAGVSTRAQPVVSDPTLGKLADRAAALSRRIDALGGVEGGARLRAAHGVLEGQIAAGDVRTAAATAKALDDAVSRLGEQA